MSIHMALALKPYTFMAPQTGNSYISTRKRIGCNGNHGQLLFNISLFQSQTTYISTHIGQLRLLGKNKSIHMALAFPTIQSMIPNAWNLCINIQKMVAMVNIISITIDGMVVSIAE